MKKLLFIALLVLLPTIAMAQQPWVLWNVVITFREDELPISVYKIASAYPTYELCIKARDGSLRGDREYLKNGPVKWKQSEECTICFDFEGKRVQANFCYKCFPAGIDPRR